MIMMRRFSTLLSITRRAPEVTRQRPFQHHHKGGGSPLLHGLVPSSTSLLLPSSNCPPVPDHATLLQHKTCGLLSRQFLHSNSRLKQPKQTKTMEIEIISEEKIKPATPTPNHLRNFKFSIFDQISYPVHTPLVLYFYNAANTSLTDVVSNISRNLKKSLSELLTRFYPFAGRIKDDFGIECNDEGVYFAEARVNYNLLDFLSQPDDIEIRRLLPQYPSARKPMLRNYVISVQMNIFDCGGIALSTSVSHKLIDGSSYITFLKAWAATMRGSSEVIHPSFIATSLFPQSRYLKNSMPTKLKSNKNIITRRFVFSATALASLKAKASPSSSSSVQGPTRVEAASSLIWKCAANAASQVRSFNQQSPHILISMVNLRKRDSPQLPHESIGNLIMAAIAVSFPKADLELASLMGQVRESFLNINYDLISKFKGNKGYLHLDGFLKQYNDLTDPLDEGDCLIITSLCKFGLYEIDFGWGKPVWFSYINPGASRIATLADTIKGDGMEATVSLSQEEMAIFECDEELLSYTFMNQSPHILLGIDSYMY